MDSFEFPAKNEGDRTPSNNIRRTRSTTRAGLPCGVVTSFSTDPYIGSQEDAPPASDFGAQGGSVARPRALGVETSSDFGGNQTRKRGPRRPTNEGHVYVPRGTPS